jgi:hypothetical protein
VVKRLDRVEKRFDGLETRLDRVEEQMATKKDLTSLLSNSRRTTRRTRHKAQSSGDF